MFAMRNWVFVFVSAVDSIRSLVLIVKTRVLTKIKILLKSDFLCRNQFILCHEKVDSLPVVILSDQLINKPFYCLGVKFCAIKKVIDGWIMKLRLLTNMSPYIIAVQITKNEVTTLTWHHYPGILRGSIILIFTNSTNMLHFDVSLSLTPIVENPDASIFQV